MTNTKVRGVSVVIPVFNEQKRLPKQLKKIQAFQKANPFIEEVIFVDDGSTDTTYNYLQTHLEDNTTFKIIHYPKNKGKGYAIKQGFHAAIGDFVLFMDADLSVPLSEIKVLLPHTYKADIIIGSRRKGIAPLYAREQKGRLAISKLGSHMRKRFLLRDIEDTQCGFKLFNKKAVEIILPRTDIEGYGFDMELLMIGKVHGLNIKEVAVPWKHANGGHLANPFNIVIAIISVFLSIVHIYFKTKNGVYARK